MGFTLPRNLKLTITYDGAPFSGWQIQPGRATIQGELAAAIERITGEKLLPQGSGRTDAGVHALSQVASFLTESTIPIENFTKALNSLLPGAIRILDTEEMHAGFHARHSATAKTYRYRIFRESVLSPFLRDYVYHHPYPLDEAAILRAARFVEGEHDFTSFAAVDPDRAQRTAEAADEDGPTNVRRIFSSTFRRNAEELVYEVSGNGFLHHMVRNLVGTFLLVGKGTLTPEDISTILKACRRAANPGATAPPQGLYLVRVDYEPMPSSNEIIVLHD
jgi:tRNA pseudouridine38-40 synthase